MLVSFGNVEELNDKLRLLLRRTEDLVLLVTEHTNLENIGALLAGKKLQFPVDGVPVEGKIYEASDINSLNQASTLYYSSIRRYVNGGGLGTGIGYDESEKAVVTIMTIVRTVFTGIYQ